MFQILALESWENVYGTAISCPKANIKSPIDVVHFIHIVLKTSHSSCACIRGLWLPCSFLWAGMWLMLNHSVPSRCVVSTPPSVHQVRQRDWGRGCFFSPLCSHRRAEGRRALTSVVWLQQKLVYYCSPAHSILRSHYACSVRADLEVATTNERYDYHSKRVLSHSLRKSKGQQLQI